MPRRPLVVLSLAVVLGLAWAGVALAAPGGIGPPTPETPSGRAISQLYWIVFAICAVVFVLVEASLVLFVIRFRRRRTTPVDAEGPQIHGNTRLEVIWTIIPAVVLVGIAVFTFARIPAVQASGEVDGALRIRVDAHQFYWQYTYPNGAVSFDTLFVPVDQAVTLELHSQDVSHSWWVPALTGKLDAIPGRTNELTFEAQRTGTYEGVCAELCGVQHAVMYTQVRVLDRAAYTNAVETAASQSPADLGEQEWTAVCAKCHGPDGEGLVGPAIAGNGTLTNLPSLRDLLMNGQNTTQFGGYMPAAGAGWPDGQISALIAYVKATPQLSMPQGGAPVGG
jgi:cytochrome c oxidase subunit II